MKRLLFSFMIAWLLGQQTDSSFRETLAVSASLYTLLVFVERIGKRIVLLECIGFIASFELLLMPAITYWWFPASMPIESEEYFNYALPSFCAFYAGLRWFNRDRANWADWQAIQSAGAYLQDKRAACVVLLLIGMGGFMVKLVWPTAPALVGTLPSYCLFASVFYAHYAASRFRFPISLIALSTLLISTVREGMFGELFLWLLLMGLFMAAGRVHVMTATAKAISLSVALVLLLLIQSIKGEYRRSTWGYQRTERTADPGLMRDLIADRLRNPEKMLNIEQASLAFVRFNQGLIIGSALVTVPSHEPFANGEVMLALIYPFVPRLVWPGKPQTGGRDNIRRFTTLPQFENTSINLSPVGEGYVNFGYGGIAFALFYGLMLSGVFRYVLHVAERIPSVILWLPALFIGCLTMETDLLSTWGSLVNTAIFAVVLFGVLKRVGIVL